MAEIGVERVLPGMQEAFEGLLRVYRDAIPESEQKSDATLRGMLQRTDYEFHVVRVADTVAAFSIVKCFTVPDGCLVEYLAVERHLRGQGIGAALFLAVCSSATTASRYVLVEVDADVTLEPGPDREMRSRRKEFYRALGCREVAGLSYIMPSVAEQQPPDMNLLIHRQTLPDAIEKSKLREWLECIYAEVYQKSVHDPRINLMLSALPDRIELH